MDRVEEIEALTSSQERWDEQMDQDSSSGKLDFLFEEAESESSNGLPHEWPQRK
jgi:hypothetical protein